MALRVSKEEARRLQAEANKRIVQHTLEGEEEDVTPAKERANEEEKAQIALFELRLVRMERYPDLKRMFATLNGVYLPTSVRKRVAQSGLVPGILDVWLPVPRPNEEGGEYKGLVVDLKYGYGKPTPEQLDWAQFLVSAGWRAYFTGGTPAKQMGLTTLEDTWYTISTYLGIVGEPPYLTDAEHFRLTQIRAEKATFRAK